jgi:predicted nuclease with TOPRIM domain
MDEPFPSVDIMTPEDEVTIPRLIDYLEEFQRRREALVHDMDLIKQHMRAKFRDINDELDRLRQERDDYKSRMANKDREFVKSESKIKALEKVINMSAAAKSTSSSSSSGVVVQSSTSSISTSSYKQSSQHSTASIVTNQAVNGSSSSTSNETHFSAVSAFKTLIYRKPEKNFA